MHTYLDDAISVILLSYTSLVLLVLVLMLILGSWLWYWSRCCCDALSLRLKYWRVDAIKLVLCVERVCRLVMG